MFFFFQAEDGIRDVAVTGVQTCALPISIVPLIDIAISEGRRQGLLPKHVVVASLRIENHHEDIRIGIAADEVIGTYSVNTEDLLEQAPENVPHCIGMLRHDDRLALVIDLRRLLEGFPGPSLCVW